MRPYREGTNPAGLLSLEEEEDGLFIIAQQSWKKF